MIQLLGRSGANAAAQRRRRLLMASCATMLAGAAASGAWAASENTAQSVSEVVVTGSRIVRDGYTAPTPVTVATAQDLVAATPTSLADGLNKLPQFANSTSPRGNQQLQANSAEHGNILNLRGVGGNRVLILFDGLRVGPTTYKGAVDVNTLPQLLVQRVDVVTAGASAAYGSDAVSGVVNFVLDSHFKGVKGVAQYGISDKGDLGNYRLGVAAGTELMDGRGHLVVSAERYKSKGILREQRPFGVNRSSAVGSVVGSTAAPGSAANPFIFATGAANTALTFGGKITASTVPSLVNLQFLPDGSLVPLARGVRTGTSTTDIGGDGFYNLGDKTLLPPLKTDQVFGRFTYDFSDNLSGYIQGDYATAVTSFVTQAGFTSGTRIFSGNAFLLPSVQARLGPTDSFVVAELLSKYGPLPTREVTDSGSVSAGLSGKFADAWTWRADFTHSAAKTVMRQKDQNVLLLAAASDAVRDASGNIVCRVTLTNPGLYPGCVPFNLMGGSPSQAALDYVNSMDSWYTSENKMDDVSASVQGDLFDLPAGPLSVAVGAEYRKQSLDLRSDSNPGTRLDVTGLRAQTVTTLFSHTNVGPAEGSVNVKEAFAEVAVPVLKDAPFARSLELNAAGRYTDYSTSGGVTTWKLGAIWAPIEDIRFRVTRSRDIRAPTLFDLYAGLQSTSATFTDPHTGQTNSPRLNTSGNPNLDPEIGKTWAAGVVFRPSFLSNFSASIDWYDLKITGAIAQQSFTDIVNECELSNGASPSCALVHRPLPFSDRTIANFPTTIDVVTQNIAFLHTSGVDVDLSYRAPVGPGDLTLRAYGNWVTQYKQQTNTVAPVLEYAGYVANGSVYYALPKFKGSLSALYSIGNTQVFIQETMVGKMKIGPPNQFFAVPDIKRYFYTDMTVTQKLPKKGLEAFLTINNLTNKQPPFVAATTSPGTTYPTIQELYDIAGRTYTAGLRFKF